MAKAKAKAQRRQERAIMKRKEHRENVTTFVAQQQQKIVDDMTRQITNLLRERADDVSNDEVNEYELDFVALRGFDDRGGNTKYMRDELLRLFNEHIVPALQKADWDCDSGSFDCVHEARRCESVYIICGTMYC